MTVHGWMPPGTVYGTLLNFQREHALWAPRMSEAPYKAPPQAPVLYIKTAQRLGFTLGEIGASVAALWNAPDPDCAVTQLLQDKLNLIETRMTELDALRHELKQRLGQRCPLNP